MTKARRLGHAAAAAGKPITDNPYTKPVYWRAWRMSWEAFHKAEAAELALNTTSQGEAA